MSTSNRTLAFLTYPLIVVGAVFVLLFRQRDGLAVYHAKQSLMLVLAAVATPLIWAISAWVLAWIPLAGPVIGLILFTLVIATYLMLIAGWIAGMIFALRGTPRPVPLVGRWAERLFGAAPRPAPKIAEVPAGALADAPELADRSPRPDG